MIKLIVRGAAAAAVVLLGSIALTTPAEASVAQGFIGGTGVVTDDWGDEGTLARDTFPNSNATGLWQFILFSDGAIERDGTTFDFADIDCQFGPNTEAATRNWQSRRGLAADGRVGPLTFGRADNNLVDRGGGSILYNGTLSDAGLTRNSNGQYLFFGAVAFYRSVTPTVVCS